MTLYYPSKIFIACLVTVWVLTDARNKFLAKVMVSSAKKSWCWTAMSAQSLSPWGKLLALKKKSGTQSRRAFSFCELTVGTWDTFEGFLILGSFSRDEWISSWLIFQKSIFSSVAREEQNYSNRNCLKKKHTKNKKSEFCLKWYFFQLFSFV